MELTLKERQKPTHITAKKYRKANKREKTNILDTFIAQTGCGRKYAIHVLANEDRVKPAGTRVRLKAAHRVNRKRVYLWVYGQAVRDTLIPV
jgi:hypothetical protein